MHGRKPIALIQLIKKDNGDVIVWTQSQNQHDWQGNNVAKTNLQRVFDAAATQIGFEGLMNEWNKHNPGAQYQPTGEDRSDRSHLEPMILRGTSPIGNDGGKEQPQAARSKEEQPFSLVDGQDAHIKRNHRNLLIHSILILAAGLFFMREMSTRLTYIVAVIFVASVAFWAYRTQNISELKKRMGRVCKRRTLLWNLFPTLLFGLLCTVVWTETDATSPHATSCCIFCALVATLRVVMIKCTVKANGKSNGRKPKGTMSHWTLLIIFFLGMAVQCSQLRDAPPEGVKLTKETEWSCKMEVKKNEPLAQKKEHDIACSLWRKENNLPSDKGECPFEKEDNWHKNELSQMSYAGGQILCRCIQKHQHRLATTNVVGSKATILEEPKCDGGQMLKARGYGHSVAHTENLSDEPREVKSFCREETSKWSRVKARCKRMKLKKKECRKRYCGKNWNKRTFTVLHTTVAHGFITDRKGKPAKGSDLVEVAYDYLDSVRTAKANEDKAQKMQKVSVLVMAMLLFIMVLLFAEYENKDEGCLLISGQMLSIICIDWLFEIAAIVVMGNACFQNHWKITACVWGVVCKGICGVILANAGRVQSNDNYENPQETATGLLKYMLNSPEKIHLWDFREKVKKFASGIPHYGENIEAMVFFGDGTANSLQSYLISNDRNKKIRAEKFLGKCLTSVQKGAQPLSWEDEIKPPFSEQLGKIVTGTGNLFLILLRCIRYIYKATWFIVKYLAVDAPSWVKGILTILACVTSNYFVFAIMRFDNRFNEVELIFAVLSMMDNASLNYVHGKMYPQKKVDATQAQTIHNQHKASFECQQGWLDWNIPAEAVNRLLPFLCFPAEFSSWSWWIFASTFIFLFFLFLCLVDECCVKLWTKFNENYERKLRELVDDDKAKA